MKKEDFDTIDSGILKSFQIIKKMGQGAYGHVWKARNKKSLQFCALKKIYDAFRNISDAQRTYREIKYLQKLQHPNIIRILSYHRPNNDRDIYISLQFMETDLSLAIKNGVLKPIHKHFIFYQIANAVHYLHAAELIHRDLKPSNILLNQKCEVKICDFGLIRSLRREENQTRLVLTENIATRCYRAPQILLCSNSYGKEVDIWSLGCVLAQIFLQRPIFSGSSAISQLEKIFQVTGKPNSQDLFFVRSKASLAIVDSLQPNSKKSIAEMFLNQDSTLIDLLQRIFQVDPRKRIKIEDIMNHPFLQRFRGSSQQKMPPNPIKIAFDSKNLSIEQYKMLLYSQLEEKQKEINPEGSTVGNVSELSTINESSIYLSVPKGLNPSPYINDGLFGLTYKLERRISNRRPSPLKPSNFGKKKQEQKEKQIGQRRDEWSKPCPSFIISHKKRMKEENQRQLNSPVAKRTKNLPVFLQRFFSPKLRAQAQGKQQEKTPDKNQRRVPSPNKVFEGSPLLKNCKSFSNLNVQKTRFTSISPPKVSAKSKNLQVLPLIAPTQSLKQSRRGSPKRVVGNRVQDTNLDSKINRRGQKIGDGQAKDKMVPRFVLDKELKGRIRSPQVLDNKIMRVKTAFQQTIQRNLVGGRKGKLVKGSHMNSQSHQNIFCLKTDKSFSEFLRITINVRPRDLHNFSSPQPH